MPAASTTSESTDGCSYCHHTNHTVENCFALKMKEFYKQYNLPLDKKKFSKFGPFSNIATYESESAILDPNSLTSDSEFNI